MEFLYSMLIWPSIIWVKAKLPTNEAKTLDEYLYRIQNLGTTENISYEVYWVKSFKSVEELKAYIGAE